jgi:hypothetical protein
LILYPHALRSLPTEAAVIHFPNPEITPQVTKISFMMISEKNKKRLNKTAGTTKYFG